MKRKSEQTSCVAELVLQAEGLRCHVTFSSHIEPYGGRRTNDGDPFFAASWYESEDYKNLLHTASSYESFEDAAMELLLRLRAAGIIRENRR